jgi:hypothetical protein
MEGDEVPYLGPNPEGYYPLVESVRNLPVVRYYTVNSKPHEVARARDMPIYSVAFVRWARSADVVGVVVCPEWADIVLVQGRRLHYFEPRSRMPSSDHLESVDPAMCHVRWFPKEGLQRAVFG